MIRLCRWLVSLFRRRVPPAPTPPTPVPLPTPEPPVPSSCVVPPDGPAWHVVEGVGSVMTASVRAAMDSLGPAPGPTPEASLDALATELIRLGHCAGRQADGLMVKRPDGLWEEHHAVSYGTGQWIATPFKGVWSHDA